MICITVNMELIEVLLFKNLKEGLHLGIQPGLH